MLSESSKIAEIRTENMIPSVKNMVQSRIPLIVVLGATGSGKSKLAIEIARKFNGEIISADSMQVYKGLDIITNKVSREERNLVKHHLIDFLDPLKYFTVVDFRNRALQVIENLTLQGKCPIVVGGTNYYIESLLWDVLVEPESIPLESLATEEDENLKSKYQQNITNVQENLVVTDQNEKGDKIADVKGILSVPITWDSSLNFSDNELHALLLSVDPVRARQIHPSDRRKILRSLQIYQKHGIPHSEFLARQSAHAGGSLYGGPLRFNNTCLLWMQCEQKTLEERIDKRVDEMIEAGLVQQMLEFHDLYNQHRVEHNLKADYTRGIFQSIGFKEFHQYLILPKEVQQGEFGAKLLNECIESMKQVTKRYSKQQIKWIKNRFLRASGRKIPPMYGLDATDPEKWQELVYTPACEIISCYIKDQQSSIQPLPLENKQINDKVSYFCNICEKTVIGSITWEVHLKSRRHHKIKKSKEKKSSSTHQSQALHDQNS